MSETKYIVIGNNPSFYEFVQKELLAQGCGWSYANKKHLETDLSNYKDDHAISIEGDQFLHYGSAEIFKEKYQEISILEILQQKVISLRLTEQYCAEYRMGNDFVQVGCQKIPVEKIRELLNLIDNK